MKHDSHPLLVSWMQQKRPVPNPEKIKVCLKLLQIQQERTEYYEVLEKSQRGALDITSWIEWYLNCMQHAIAASEMTLEAVLAKARFWEAHAGQSFNDRQREVINRLLDGFEGKLTSSKWAKLTKCSQDTALRDISDLLERKILAKEEAGGRSTSYRLQVPKRPSQKPQNFGIHTPE